MTADALTPKEARALMGMARQTFRDHEKAGAFNHLRLPQDIGRKRYSRRKFEQWLAGELTRTFGGRQAFRRTA